MIIKRIALYNFRSYDEREFEFSDTVTMIVGLNGIGKTNILEAVYTLFQGKSFRDGDEQLTQYDQEWWKLVGSVDDVERELRYQLGQTSPKQIHINGVAKGRFAYKQQLPVVLFEPDDLMMIHGSPGMRRKYLDGVLLKLDSSYRTILAKYERALLQRNNLLKKGLSLNDLRDFVFVWDIALSEYGREITKRRRELVEAINELLSDEYSRIAIRQHHLNMRYEQTMSSVAESATEALANRLAKDVLRGFTSIGPHRDDVEFMLDGKPAKQTASRGEVRTIVLALKQIEIQIITKQTSTVPVLLMDDVFSELDTERQKGLISGVSAAQKIITTTDYMGGSVTKISL